MNDLKVGCVSYSYHRAFGEGKIDIQGFVRKAYEFKLDGVEILDYHTPKDRSSLIDLKRLALRLGVELAGVTINPCVKVTSMPSLGKPYSGNWGGHPYSTPADPITKAKEWIDITAFLGAPVIRIDTPFYGKEEGRSAEELIKEAIDFYGQCAEYGGKRGITVLMENHGGPIGNAEAMLRIIKEVDSEWLRVLLDTGNFGFDESAYDQMKKVAEHILSVHARVFDGVLPFQEFCTTGKYWRGAVGKLDYRRILRILDEAGYNGYLHLERSVPSPIQPGFLDDFTAVPKSLEFLKRLISR